MVNTSGMELEIYKRVGEGDGLSGLDSRLLDLAAQRMTPEEIAAELSLDGITPARVAQRIREILKSQDWLSIAEQKGLILLDVIKLRDILFERVEGTETRFTKDGQIVEVESGAAYFQAMIRLLKEWRDIIQSLQLDVDADTLKVRQAHAKIMGRAIESTFKAYNATLRTHGYDIPPEVAMLAMEDALPVAFRSLEADTE